MQPQSTFPADFIARFWARVAEPTSPGGCREWMGARSRRGYGHVSHRGVLYQASRVALILAMGPLPDGVNALHRCDNPPCCEQSHLFPGSQAENVADMHDKGRARKATGERNGAHTQPERRPRGQGNGRAKLTAAEVAEIRAALVRGDISKTALAERHGVSRGTINFIAGGSRWRDA